MYSNYAFIIIISRQCFPKSAEKKHHSIAHEPLTCECGQELTQLSLHHHQLTQCVKRSVECQFKWCQLVSVCHCTFFY